ncbi:MAG: hypothetical protein RLZZ93_1204 [Actinomycetota bacterium]
MPTRSIATARYPAATTAAMDVRQMYIHEGLPCRNTTVCAPRGPSST